MFAVLDTPSLHISALGVSTSLGEAPHAMLSVAAILDGCLSRPRFSCLIVPGGDPQPALDALGARGRLAIHAFLRSGGGFMGICAGANVAVELGLVRLQRRGSNWYHFFNPAATLLSSTATMAVPPAARGAWEDVFGAPAPAAPRRVSFMHSPLLFPWEGEAALWARVAAALPEHIVPAEADAGAVEVLARYGEDLWAEDTAASAPAAVARALGGGGDMAAFAERQAALDGAVPGAAHAPAGFMPAAAAVCRAAFGGGRVLLFSPHPEAACDGATENRELVRRGAAWAAGGGGGGAQAAAPQLPLPPLPPHASFPPPCAHAAAALAEAAAAAPCGAPAGGELCAAAAAAEGEEAVARPSFACLRHLRAGAYRRCQAPGCASNTRGLYACLACGATLCGRGAGTHMGSHAEGAHGGRAVVAVYFGIPPGAANGGLRGGRGGQAAAHAWCYACEAACGVSS
jgi:hypothetical protein